MQGLAVEKSVCTEPTQELGIVLVGTKNILRLRGWLVGHFR